MTPSVVITGLGVVSPLGCSVEELARCFCAGESAVRRLAGMGVDGTWGAAVEDIPLRGIPADVQTRSGRLDRISRLFLSASYLAVESAELKITAANAERCGLSFGTGFGCLLADAEYNQKLVEQGPAAASPRLFAYTVSSAAAGEVSIALGIRGANVTTHMGFAAGLGAVGYGCDLIRMGKADVVLAGGADALGEALVRGLADMGLLKMREATAVAFRDAVPGVYPAEGAVVAVLECREHARQRGARGWARIDGYAAGFEPTLTRRSRAPAGIAATMRRALAASGHAAGDIDLVVTSAHATAVDDTERQALAAVFGASAPLLFAPKAAWGECFAASGPLSLALASVLLQAPPPVMAADRALELRGTTVQAAREVAARLQQARVAMVHDLCYSGPTVALVVAREE